MKILVTGSNGQLGTDVVSLLKQDPKNEILPYTRNEVNLLYPEKVINTIQAANPDWIVHCAAFTNVEAAENKEKELNWQINRDGSKAVAEGAKLTGSKLIFISTDYVFDGEMTAEYEPNAQTHPINEYGAAKLAGENAILEIIPDAYIIRTSWVFGENGKNFVYTMRHLSEKMDTLKVVNDQFGRPTYTKDLAAFIDHIIKNMITAGIYHFSNQGTATWYDFALEILKDKETDVVPVDSSAFPQEATRPKHSVMSLKKVEATGFHIPTWQNALERFLENIQK